jgi:hypothetical protein
VTYKHRIKPKSVWVRVRAVFLILIALIALTSPFTALKMYILGRETVQEDIIRAIHRQDNVKIDRLIITSRNGRGNEFSVIFPADWEG